MWESLFTGLGSALVGSATSALGKLIPSGGTSNADLLQQWDSYYKPTKYGWSRAQLEQQLAIEAYRKQLQSSASQSVQLSEQLNRLLPSATVEGLVLAGLNPILAVLGSGFSPVTASASAPGVSMKSGLGNISRPSRSNSAGNAESFYRMFSGLIDASKEQKDAQTKNLEAQNSNITATNKNLEAQNDLIHAQADKTRAESESIRDKTGLGDSWFSDFLRIVRSAGEYLFPDDGYDPSKTIELINHSAKSEDSKPSVSIILDKDRRDSSNHVIRDLDSIHDWYWDKSEHRWKLK